MNETVIKIAVAEMESGDRQVYTRGHVSRVDFEKACASQGYHFYLVPNAGSLKHVWLRLVTRTGKHYDSELLIVPSQAPGAFRATLPATMQLNTADR